MVAEIPSYRDIIMNKAVAKAPRRLVLLAAEETEIGETGEGMVGEKAADNFQTAREEGQSRTALQAEAGG